MPYGLSVDELCAAISAFFFLFSGRFSVEFRKSFYLLMYIFDEVMPLYIGGAVFKPEFVVAVNSTAVFFLYEVNVFG